MVSYKQILGLIILTLVLLYLLTHTKTFLQYTTKEVPTIDIQKEYHIKDFEARKRLSSRAPPQNGYEEYIGTINIFKSSTETHFPTQAPFTTTKLPHKLTWPFPPNSPCKRSVTSRTNDEGRWYEYSRGDFVLYTYSALVDDRDSLETGPVVRIISISTNVAGLPNRPHMYCRFYFPISEETAQDKRADTEQVKDLVIDIQVEEAPDRFIGMGWPLNGKGARETIYTCYLPTKEEVLNKLKATHSNYTGAYKHLEKYFTIKKDYLVPSLVSMLVGKEDGGYKYHNITSCMPIEAPKRLEKPREFALCVQVAFGPIDPKRLLIWIELQKLLGVDEIGIYDQNVDEPAMEVLRFYADQGLVDLRKSDYIPHGHQQYLLHGSPVINDCMYRHLHTHEHLLVYDLDEVILPVKNTSTNTPSNFHELLENLRKTYGSGDFNYVFRNRYFFFDHKPDTKEPQEFDILKYKLAAPLSNVGYSTKSMLSMKLCIQMHNHFCWGPTQRYKSLNSLDVSPKLASNQHYKKCHLGAECANMIKDSQHFDAMTAYKDDLIKNVYEAVQKIRPRFKSSNLYDPFNEFNKKI